MKTFDQLTEDQKRAAVNKCVERIVEDIVSGAIRFNDKLNGDDLQARIDAALDKAEKLRTPWFAGAHVLDACSQEIEGMALCDAEDALYSEGERVISGIVTDELVPQLNQ